MRLRFKRYTLDELLFVLVSYLSRHRHISALGQGLDRVLVHNVVLQTETKTRRCSNHRRKLTRE